MLIRLLPIVSLALLVPRVAEASLCTLEPVTLTVPVNCPFVIYKRPDGTPLPSIQLMRGDQYITVTPELTKSTPVNLQVYYSDPCDGALLHETRTEPYDILELSLPGSQVGDVLMVSNQGQTGLITEAGACSAPYAPECNSSGYVECPMLIDPIDEAEAGGCDAGGGATPWLGGFGLGLAALVRRRRR